MATGNHKIMYWADMGTTSSISIKYATRQIISNYLREIDSAKGRKKLADRILAMTPGSTTTIIMLPTAFFTTIEKIREDHETRNQVKSAIKDQNLGFVITARIEDEDYVFDRYPGDTFCEMIEE